MSGNQKLNIDYDTIHPYAISLYLKEDLMWDSDRSLKPEEPRCLKIQRKGDSFINQPDYFCIYFARNDVKMGIALDIIQARYQAEMYANKVNVRLQCKALNKSLSILNTSKNSLEIDSNILCPIKNQVRIDYFIAKHELLFYFKNNKITADQFELEIKKTKEKIVNSVCSGIEICKKAINLSLNKGLLPLNGYREKFALDIQNPYNSLAPKSSLKINLPNGGSLGQKLLEQVHDLISSQNSNRNYILDQIPDSAPGEIPNVTSIKKAFNTVRALRDLSKVYYRLEQIGQNCRVNIRINSNNLKRKIAILSYVGDNDTFFEYLGKIRYIQSNHNFYR
jgi:hypothetical protein